jgi:hypothetical protein
MCLLQGGCPAPAHLLSLQAPQECCCSHPLLTAGDAASGCGWPTSFHLGYTHIAHTSMCLVLDGLPGPAHLLFPSTPGMMLPHSLLIYAWRGRGWSNSFPISGHTHAHKQMRFKPQDGRLAPPISHASLAPGGNDAAHSPADGGDAGMAGRPPSLSRHTRAHKQMRSVSGSRPVPSSPMHF